MKKSQYVFVLVGILVLMLGVISGAETFSATTSQFSGGQSTSFSNVQYSSPRISNQFGGQYNSLLSGPSYRSRAGMDSEFFDLAIGVPPGGCSPMVVRSDLLEEQNVPVFCEVASYSVNPGVDISRIDNINFRQTERNPYVAGVGFHPSRAAIRSVSRYVNTPVDGNLGYVVVVLKRQETEADMPDNLTVQLSAVLRYDAKNTFGIGQTEFYIPVLEDSEFQNKHKEYGFWNGIAYLRTERLEENGAVIGLYDSQLRKITSVSLREGQPSNNIYIPTSTGGQGVQITLRDITLPETKARINVNGEEFEVYKNKRFSDSNCVLQNVEAYGAGAGKAIVRCGSNSFTLEKSFGSVNIEGKDYKIGDKFGNVSNVYVSYIGLAPAIEGELTPRPYAVLSSKWSILSASQGKPKELDKFEIRDISKDIDKTVKKTEQKSGDFIENLKSSLKHTDSLSSITWEAVKGLYNVITGVASGFIVGGSIQIDSVVVADYNLQNGDLGKSKDYYGLAMDSYKDVKDDYTNENYGDGVSYGQEALCRQYSLAKDLGQEEKARGYLFLLAENYPDAACKDKSVNDLLEDTEIFSNEGATGYSEKEDIYLELISVTEPSNEDAGIEFRYEPQGKETKEYSLGIGERKEMHDDLDAFGVDILSNTGTKITLDRIINENTARIKYSCTWANFLPGGAKGSVSKTIEVKVGQKTDLDACKSTIYIEDINYNQVAQIKLTPTTRGRSRESNLTVNIGIEKRSELFKLTPEKANERIKELNDTLEQLNEINENLGNVVEGMKVTCLATSAALTVKNLFAGVGGETTARREVMQGTNGWNEICANLVSQGSYSSVDKCLLDKNSEIETDVDLFKAQLKSVNDNIDECEDKEDISETKLFSTTVNQEKAKECYYDNVVSGIELEGDNAGIIEGIKVSGGDATYSELREIELYSGILGDSSASASMKDLAQKRLDSVMSIIGGRQTTRIKLDNQKAEGYSGITLGGERTIRENYVPKTWGAYKEVLSTKFDLALQDDQLFEIVTYKSKDYIYVLEKNGETAVIQSIHSKTNSKGETRLIFDPEDKPIEDGLKQLIDVNFEIVDENTYNNKCINCDEAKFYASEPYKGLPAMIPFDVNKGWYVATQQTLPVGKAVESYYDSGALNSYYICNVGKNGLMQGVKMADDPCQRIDTFSEGSYRKIFSLTEAESKSLVNRAQRAIQDASRQYANNPSAKSISIFGNKLNVASSALNPGSQCTDFMSPRDCQIMFNVCDPVICPSSRCDLGGQYKVDDVIQSGIVGSIALCLPNWKLLGGDVYVPVCLTGIHAGIEGWVSILEGYRDCLQESIDTGKMTGVCDEIHSVYVCDFFWKQIGPFFKAITQNLFAWTLGQGTHGGGEYTLVQDAFNNAEQSWNHFTTSYASSSKLGFGARSIGELGSEVCKAQVSATYPDDFGSMLEAESPEQVNAWFDEMDYTSATIPPISQYKVFYHIFAGNDEGAYYSVYLKDAPQGVGYTSQQYITIDSGYAGKGETISETKDFTAPKGYKTLCVRINTKDYCGFKSVSTGFISNYAKDTYLEQQATAPVNNEEECISGTSSLGALALTPNIQQGVEDAIDPQLYNQGITRVCATNNPGEGVEASRWQEIGSCGGNLKCWTDTKSVQNAIQGTGIEERTLKEMQELSLQDEIEDGSLLTVDGGDSGIKSLQNEYAWVFDEIKSHKLDDSQVTAISKLDDNVKFIQDKLILNDQKANLLLFKALIYEKVARELFPIKSNAEDVTTKTGTGDEEEGEGGDEIKDIPEVRTFNEGGYFIFGDKIYSVNLGEFSVTTDLSEENIQKLIDSGVSQDILEIHETYPSDATVYGLIEGDTVSVGIRPDIASYSENTFVGALGWGEILFEGTDVVLKVTPNTIKTEEGKQVARFEKVDGARIIISTAEATKNLHGCELPPRDGALICETKKVTESIHPIIHEAELGDTWETVAMNYGILISSVKGANSDISDRDLKIGDEVEIPLDEE